jgi:hypothetical protein
MPTKRQDRTTNVVSSSTWSRLSSSRRPPALEVGRSRLKSRALPATTSASPRTPATRYRTGHGTRARQPPLEPAIRSDHVRVHTVSRLAGRRATELVDCPPDPTEMCLSARAGLDRGRFRCVLSDIGRNRLRMQVTVTHKTSRPTPTSRRLSRRRSTLRACRGHRGRLLTLRHPSRWATLGPLTRS